MTVNDVIREIEEQQKIFPASKYMYLNREETDFVLTIMKQLLPVRPVLAGHMWECGECGAPVGIYLDDRRDDFCRRCGREVNWDA